jgi:hypothetical protein
MKYVTYLIIGIIFLLCCGTVLGDEQRYRVELIVLRYLEGSSQIPVLD